MNFRSIGSRLPLLPAHIAVGLLLAGLVISADALTESERNEELRYVDGLNRLRLPAYAEIVLSRLGTGPEIKTRKLQSYLARGQFDEVKAIIDAEPNQDSLETWAMRVTLADGYFAWGRYEEARAIYEKFFAKYTNGPPEALKSFYMESAYKFGQMLLLLNDTKGAIAAYKNALNAKPPAHVVRQLKGDMAELMLKVVQDDPASRDAYIKEVDTIVDDLLWQTDLWFGKAIVMKAHLMMMRKDINGAMKLIDDYTDQLVTIDEALEEQNLSHLSPMAQARYLLGVMLLTEAKKIIDANGNLAEAEEMLIGKEIPRTGRKPQQLPGAVQHFVNVFVRFANTPWASDAGDRFEETKVLLKRLGREVKFEPTPEQWKNVEEQQLKNARTVFNQQQYEEAAKLYTTALARFPQTESSLAALGDLATCYIETKNDLYADMVIRYIAERYSARREGTTAGNLVLNFAKMYGDRDRADRKEQLYAVFFDNFKRHPLAARLLYSFGERRLAAGDVAAALPYYMRVATDYERLPVSYEALNKLAVCYAKSDDAENEIKTLNVLVKRLVADKRSGHLLIRSLYRLGTAFRKLDAKYYAAAVARYSEIVKRLEGNRDAYQSSATEAEKNQEILEAAIYFKAYCYSKTPPPKGKPADIYKRGALGLFLKLAESYPKSKLTPQALSQAGTLYTIFGKPDEAQTIFERLKKNYPNSVEASNVDFLLGMSLLDLGLREQAIPVFKNMFAGGGTYSEAQILTAGRELLKAGEYAIAVEAFDRVLARAQDNRALLEPALAGKGRALVALGNFADGAKALDDLFEKFPRTSFTVNAAFDLSRAYANLAGQEPNGDTRFDLFNASISAMRKVKQHDESAARRAQINVEVGRIQALKAKAEQDFGSKAKAAEYANDAIGSYQTVILFENPQESGVRPHFEEAFHESIKLFESTERWQDIFDDSNRYLELFPSGKYKLEMQNQRSRSRAKLIGAGEIPTDSDGSVGVVAPEAPAVE